MVAEESVRTLARKKKREEEEKEKKRSKLFSELQESEAFDAAESATTRRLIHKMKAANSISSNNTSSNSNSNSNSSFDVNSIVECITNLDGNCNAVIFFLSIYKIPFFNL